ncbi:MAG: tetratricopeptide repeat protein [Candidatus Paracaedibacteraceae bacterium]|nr:tetratricopeptide repeat protein [Candidatus Paracaedibacteraceae bacterium]
MSALKVFLLSLCMFQHFASATSEDMYNKIESYKSLAEHGNKEACSQLLKSAFLYLKDPNIQEKERSNYNKIAFDLCFFAADKGFKEAQFSFGLLTAGGLDFGSFDSKIVDGMYEAKSITEMLNQADAINQNPLAFHLSERANPWTCRHYSSLTCTRAIDFFTNAANQGHIEAQYHLGLANASLAIKGENLIALDWFKRAADQNHVNAQYQLGMYYAHYAPAKKNHDLAKFWLEKATNQGHKQAQHQITAYLDTLMNKLSIS